MNKIIILLLFFFFVSSIHREVRNNIFEHTVEHYKPTGILFIFLEEELIELKKDHL